MNLHGPACSLQLRLRSARHLLFVNFEKQCVLIQLDALRPVQWTNTTSWMTCRHHSEAFSGKGMLRSNHP